MILPTTFAPFFLLALVSARDPSTSATVDGSHRPVEPSVLRVYDLRTVLPGPMMYGANERLLPYLSMDRRWEGEEGDSTGGADMLIDLFRESCGDEFDYEGRSIHLDERGRLFVRAPAAAQAHVEAFLGFLENVLGASTDIRVDAVELPEVAGAEAVPAILTVADADKLLARGDRGGVRTWRLRVHAGETAGLDLTRVTSLVTDYDAEIAQASAIADPIVDDVPVGTRIFARAAPAAGGTWLSMILRRGDPLGNPVDRDISINGQVTTQERVMDQAAARVYQTLEVLNRSIAVDTYLPEGRVLAIQSSITSGGKTRAEVLLVRRESGSLPIHRQVTLDPKSDRGGKILFLNGESIVPPSCLLEMPSLPKFAHPDNWEMPWHTNSTAEIGLSARFAPSALDLLGEFLTESDDQLSIRNVGPCLFLSRDPSSTRETAPLLPGPGTDGVSILDAFTPAARIVQVTALLRRAGGTLPIARCSIPIRIGESGCAVLGTESIEVGDYNVEVAQSASIADTVMRIGFDGIALEFRPGFAPSGNLTIGLTARAHVRRGERRELSLGVRSLGTLDESTYDQLFVRETLVFAKSESAPKRFLLGDASQNSTLGTLSLEVEAVEVR